MQGTNLATSKYDLGNKMTLNGVFVKDIPGFIAYYHASTSGPMILFYIPEDYIEPTGEYEHTTLYLPEGTQIFSGITANDVNLFIVNNHWVSTDKWSIEPEVVDDYDYSFAIVGDTQIINYYNPDDFSNIYGWIVDNAESKKIVHTIGLGDITDKDSADEWARARESFDELEAAGNTYTS